MKRIKRGEIRLCDLGEGYGSIQGGVRPVLIVQNNKGNKYSPTALVCPITSKTRYKAKLPTHMILTKNMGLKQTSLLLTEQIITVNKFSIGRKIAQLSPSMMEKADKCMGISLNLSNQRHKNIFFRKKRK